MTQPEPIVPLVPVQPEPSPLRPSASNGRSRRPDPSPFVRVGIVTGTAALVLMGAVAAMGASPAQTDPSSSNTPAASGDPDSNHTGPGRWGMGGMGIMGGMGSMGGVEHGLGESTIAAIDGSSLSLKTDDGWTRTITVTGTTTITRAGATIAVGDLAVGDQIRFAETKATDGSYSITKIVVVMPSLVGQVTARTGDTISITQRDGTTATIHVTGTTTYAVQGVTGATLTDIAVGMRVAAEGSLRADGSLDAASVTAGVGGHGFGPGGDRDHDGTTPGASPSASATPG